MIVHVAKQRSDGSWKSLKTRTGIELRVHVDTDGVDAVWFSFGIFSRIIVGVKG
jgi:hypothetical protein